MKDIRMPTPFTTSNAEELAWGQISIAWWPKKERERGIDRERERERKRQKAESLE